MHSPETLTSHFHFNNVTYSVIIVLVNFKDKAMGPNAVQYFEDLFFSKKKIPTGSVTEYYSDVSGQKISITGDVKGPYNLPQTRGYYAHGGNGIKGPALESEPNARTMANDAVTAVDADGLDLSKYNNKGRDNNYVDAFIIVHPGRGGEETPDVNDI
jgi:immune inhibitor A